MTLQEQSLHELIDDCVHCGFCLPGCPTYDLWSEEMDSPRERINAAGCGSGINEHAGHEPRAERPLPTYHPIELLHRPISGAA